MTGWMFIWTMLLIIVLLIYSVVAFFVTIGGAKDIREMLQKIKDK